MPRFQSLLKTLIVTVTVATLFSLLGWAQEASTLRGKVVDEQSGIIIGADIALIDTSGGRRETATDNEGVFIFSDLMPGRHILEISVARFEVYVQFVDLPFPQTAPPEM